MLLVSDVVGRSLVVVEIAVLLNQEISVSCFLILRTRRNSLIIGKMQHCYPISRGKKNSILIRKCSQTLIVLAIAGLSLLIRYRRRYTLFAYINLPITMAENWQSEVWLENNDPLGFTRRYGIFMMSSRNMKYIYRVGQQPSMSSWTGSAFRHYYQLYY